MSWTMSHRNYVVIPGQVPSTRCRHIGSRYRHTRHPLTSPLDVRSLSCCRHCLFRKHFFSSAGNFPLPPVKRRHTSVTSRGRLCHDDTAALRTSVWTDLTNQNLPFASLLNYAPPPPHPHPIQLFSNGITETLLLCDPVLAGPLSLEWRLDGSQISFPVIH